MPSIESAVVWAINIANDNTHGYDQADRDGPNYDCSSFVGHALYYAGFNVNPLFTTYTMVSALKSIGFVEVTNGIRQRGDILVREDAHTVMCINGTQIVHASINENGTVTGGLSGDQTGAEICVTDYWDYGWNYHLRYSELNYIVTKDMVQSGNTYLTYDQMKINAIYIFQYLIKDGWTINSISAMLGNMESESTINPGIWESLIEGNTEGGFGLVQWTPATKLIEWCSSNSLDYKDIDAQLERIIWEYENNAQWYPTADYPMTFEEFKRSTDSVETLAYAFLYNYERPYTLDQPNRKTQARAWYNLLLGYNPIYSTKKKKGYKFVLFTRRRLKG